MERPLVLSFTAHPDELFLAECGLCGTHPGVFVRSPLGLVCQLCADKVSDITDDQPSIAPWALGITLTAVLLSAATVTWIVVAIGRIFR